MPTYEYSCNDCGHRFDVVQSIHDDSLTACPNCGGGLRKLFGNVGVVFKGSGFYKNDSREKSKPKKPATAAKAGSDAKSSSDSAGGDTSTKTAKESPSTTPSSSSSESSSTSTPTNSAKPS